MPNLVNTYTCLYTKHKTQKRKVFNDGFLKLNTQTGHVSLHSALHKSSIDEVDLDRTDVIDLLRGVYNQIELPGFLVDPEGSCAGDSASRNVGESSACAFDPEEAFGSRADTAGTQASTRVDTNVDTNAITRELLKRKASTNPLLNRKFQKPKTYVPKPRELQRIEQSQTNPLANRRAPLQPGQLQERFYGSGSGQTQGGQCGGQYGGNANANFNANFNHPVNNNPVAPPQHVNGTNNYNRDAAANAFSVSGMQPNSFSGSAHSNHSAGPSAGTSGVVPGGAGFPKPKTNLVDDGDSDSDDSSSGSDDDDEEEEDSGRGFVGGKFNLAMTQELQQHQNQQENDGGSDSQPLTQLAPPPPQQPQNHQNHQHQHQRHQHQQHQQAPRPQQNVRPPQAQQEQSQPKQPQQPRHPPGQMNADQLLDLFNPLPPVAEREKENSSENAERGVARATTGGEAFKVQLADGDDDSSSSSGSDDEESQSFLND
jgi:hypothetical protein